jgi:metal-responsive CopG/Arc/MetJ family transcriptional regulator
MSGLSRIGVAIDSGLLAKFDKLIGTHGRLTITTSGAELK